MGYDAIIIGFHIARSSMEDQAIKRDGTEPPPIRDITFAITTDTGRLAEQSRLLCKSIDTYHPDAEIINFIPESSIHDLSNRSKKYFEKNSTVVTGEIPIPEYKISAKLKSFRKAASISNRKYIIMLDSDTVLVSQLALPDNDADLYVKPVGVGAVHWGSTEAIGDWKKLYDRFDVSFPSKRIQSTVDKHVIFPYWNSAVVISCDKTVPQELMEMTEIIFREEIIERDETHFFDQLALAVLSETRNVTQLWELQNYPLYARLLCNPRAQILHYMDYSNLLRIPNPDIRSKLRSLGVRFSNINFYELLNTIKLLIPHRSGKHMSFEQKIKLWRFVMEQFSR